MRSSRSCLQIGLLLLAAALGGCATPPPASDPEALADFKRTNDPLEPMNRVLYAVNDGIDAVIFKPLALGYHYAVPGVVRTHVHDALSNLTEPVVFANDVLQGTPDRAGSTLKRFAINSTLGIGGIFDWATGMGFPAHDSDFGETLAIWGVPEGPFLFLPVLGPTDPRDAAGYGVNIVLDPFTWIGQGQVVSNLGYTRYGMTVVDTRESLLGDLDKVKAQALDPYATFRSLYRQHRRGQIARIRKDLHRHEPAAQ